MIIVLDTLGLFASRNVVDNRRCLSVLCPTTTLADGGAILLHETVLELDGSIELTHNTAGNGGTRGSFAGNHASYVLLAVSSRGQMGQNSMLSVLSGGLR